MRIPQWLLVAVIAPLVVAAFGNAWTAYKQIQAQQLAIDKLQKITKALPSAEDYQYLRRRLTVAENHIKRNTRMVNQLAQSIAVMRAKRKGLSWHPPMRREFKPRLAGNQVPLVLALKQQDYSSG